MADEPVKVTKRVFTTVSSLVLERDGDKFKASWKIPAMMTNQYRDDRAEFLDAQIDMPSSLPNQDVSGEAWAVVEGNGFEGPPQVALDDAEGIDLCWVKGLALTTNFEKPYDRSRFHPVVDGRTVGEVTLSVHGGNSSGVGGTDPHNQNALGRGPRASISYHFQKPEKPEVELMPVSDDYGVKFKVTSDEGAGNAERHDTIVRVKRQDNAAHRTDVMVGIWESTDETEYEVSPITIQRLKNLERGQWVTLWVEAKCRGMAGDSESVESKYTACWPAQATVTDIIVSPDALNGYITVKCQVRTDEHSIVDKMTLQRLKGEFSTIDEAKASGEWEDVTGGIHDGSVSRGFTDLIVDATPSVNQHTWYRIKTERVITDTFSYTTYSTPKEAVKLFRANTTPQETVKIDSIESNADGDALIITIGWDGGDSDGTEVSWSVHEDAWESSDPPTTVDVTWEDESSCVQGKAHSAHLTVYGLDEGTAYYFKARRYDDGDDGRTYGAYCTPASVDYPATPASKPASVQLYAPAFVYKGDEVELTWTVESESPQKQWIAYAGGPSSKRVVGSGDDAIGHAVVQGAAAQEQYMVSASTGGAFADSEWVTVQFVSKPAFGMTVIPLLSAQPLSVTFWSDMSGCAVSMEVYAMGITATDPEGVSRQLYGDVVWSGTLFPSWTSSERGYTATVTLPTGLDFKDKGRYVVSAFCVDPVTGMSSTRRVGGFIVNWSHQALAPTATVSVSSDGIATVTPFAPAGSAAGDKVDVYRITPDGVTKIAASVEYGSAVVDSYAPFSDHEMHYRVVNRTSDGDVEWTDVPYTHVRKTMRFDWEGGSVELPYNVVRSDSWTKDFERRQHLDGSRPGYWNEGADRDASLSTDLVRFRSQADQESVRALARHAGPIFVRLPNGCAYEANVEVDNFSESYNSGAVEASFKVNEVSPSGAFDAEVTTVRRSS